MAYKSLLIEKEPAISQDDGKISRDHKRHFSVSRVIGHDLEMPGAIEWQVNRDSAQQCWVCDRKQFTFFFWSPEFGQYDQSKVAWLGQEEKDKILSTICVDRDTSNLRESHR